jgi:energy-converting hydrogenase Eha subunit C
VGRIAPDLTEGAHHISFAAANLPIHLRNGTGRSPQVVLIGGTAVSHFLRRAISGAIMAAIVVIGVVWAVVALLYLSGLALMLGGTLHR